MSFDCATNALHFGEEGASERDHAMLAKWDALAPRLAKDGDPLYAHDNRRSARHLKLRLRRKGKIVQTLHLSARLGDRIEYDAAEERYNRAQRQGGCQYGRR